MIESYEHHRRPSRLMGDDCGVAVTSSLHVR